MRSFLLCVLGFATLAEAQMGHDLRPALGINAPQDYESVAASDGSGLPPGSGTADDGQNDIPYPVRRPVMALTGSCGGMHLWVVRVR
jgi:hypothetical protein